MYVDYIFYGFASRLGFLWTWWSLFYDLAMLRFSLFSRCRIDWRRGGFGLLRLFPSAPLGHLPFPSRGMMMMMSALHSASLPVPPSAAFALSKQERERERDAAATPKVDRRWPRRSGLRKEGCRQADGRTDGRTDQKRPLFSVHLRRRHLTRCRL